MSYASVKSDFMTLLNRTDCSDAMADTFIQQAVQRIQRGCRLPSMERSQIITAGDAVNFVMIPQDLIQVIDIYWSDPTGARMSLQSEGPKALEKLPYRDLARKSRLILPSYYGRFQAQFWFAGNIMPGEQITIYYYGNFSPWLNADVDNELSASTPDLLVYGALSYAGDFFEMDQAQGWQQIYQVLKAEVDQMAIDLDAEGGPQIMQSTYNWE